MSGEWIFCQVVIQQDNLAIVSFETSHLEFDNNYLLQDIDECQVGKECEGQNKFCVNTEGSFKCMDCDKVSKILVKT